MIPLHLVCARGSDVVGALAVVLDRVVDINTAPGSEHLLYADAYLVLWRPRVDRADLNGPQESAGQHHVRELVCRWTHNQMSRLAWALHYQWQNSCSSPPGVVSSS